MTDQPERRSRSTEAFWGRRRGKALRGAQAEALVQTLPRLRVDIAAPAPADPRLLFAGAVDQLWLEIGFGGGEHLIAHARNRPDTGFFGVEPFVNSMAKLVAMLEVADPGNIRLHDDDATELLDWLPGACLDGIDLLYPDPWPKPKHWKRRFVSDRNLDRFARVLKPGGVFRFASDIDTYVTWTLDHCARHAAFRWTQAGIDECRTPFPGWPGTRYEAKARREGRGSAYLVFRRA